MNSFLKKCVSFTLFLIAPAVGLFAQHFVCMSNTGNNMTILVQASINPTADGTALSNGDEIGVFTLAGLCVSAAVWSGSNLAITVWGDNDQTTAIDGIAVGEQLSFRVWDASLSREALAAVTYTSGGPNYAVDGIAILASLTAISPPSVPTLSSPANGATGISITPALSWNTVRGATTYHVQVSTANDFSSILQQDSTLTGTSKTLSALSNGTPYYWRVRAKNTGGVSGWSSTWNFITIRQFTITITASHGSVTKAPDQAQYDSGTVVTLTPVADFGYQFTGWSGDLTGSANPAQIAMTGAKNITANFGLNTYGLTISCVGNGTVTPSGTVSVSSGSSTSIKAVPNAGYNFSHWTIAQGSAAIADSTKDSTTVVLSGGNAEVRALFTKKTYVLTISGIVGQDAPVKVKDTIVTHGDTLHLNAPAVTGIVFLRWRFTAGTAVLLDSMQTTCRVILLSGNATIAAMYDRAVSIITPAKQIPTSYGISYNSHTGIITFAIPKTTGFSETPVRIRMYDARGQLMGTVFDRRVAPGYYNASAGQKGKTAMEMVICRMEASGFCKTISILSK